MDKLLMEMNKYRLLKPCRFTHKPKVRPQSAKPPTPKNYAPLTDVVDQ